MTLFDYKDQIKIAKGRIQLEGISDFVPINFSVPVKYPTNRTASVAVKAKATDYSEDFGYCIELTYPRPDLVAIKDVIFRFAQVQSEAYNKANALIETQLTNLENNKNDY